MTQLLDSLPVFADEAEELEFVLEDLDAKFQVGDPTIHPLTGLFISDSQYEALVDRLREIKPDSKVFKGIQPSKDTWTGAKIVHNPPLTSITKANGTWDEKVARLEKFFGECAAELGYTLPDNFGQDDDDSGLFSMELKIDGASLALYYEPDPHTGVTTLVRAGLRPRLGVEGPDVTANVMQIKSIPKTLPTKDVFVSIRGEVYCPRGTFARVNAELFERGEIKVPFANPRNYVAGSIKLEDPQDVAFRQLAFMCHGMHNIHIPKASGVKVPTTQDEKQSLACAWKFDTVPVLPFRWSEVKKYEESTDRYVGGVGIDGLVVKVNNEDDYQQMGNEGDDPIKEPRGAIAWKFPDEEAEVPIEEIVWQVGRTGEVTPVGTWATPVRLAETDVKRCTLHSLGYMRKKGIKLGSKGMIKKSGMIIPDFIRVTSGGGQPEFPDACPSCGHPTAVEEGGKDEDGDPTFSLVCNNSYCPAQVVNTLVHYLQTFGCKGVGGSAVRKMYDAKIVNSPADFYGLTIPTLVEAGLSERQAMIALGAIHMIDKASKKDDAELTRLLGQAMSQKKAIPVWQLFGSFGIHHAGKTAGKNLQVHFGSFDAIRGASYDDLLKVTKIGPITAKAIRDFFTDQADMLDVLLGHVEPIGPKTGKLSGITFCLSGSFENGKDYWEKKIEEEGGRTTGSVGKTMAKKDGGGKPLGYLVEGPDAGGKVQKAKDYGVPILSLDDLKKML